MEKIITEHEVTGPYKFIREITTTYFTTSNGVEHKGEPHRHPQHVPGTLVDTVTDSDEKVYVKTDVNTLDTDAKMFATHFWTPELHADFETLLRSQEETSNLLASNVL